MTSGVTVTPEARGRSQVCSASGPSLGRAAVTGGREQVFFLCVFFGRVGGGVPLP